MIFSNFSEAVILRSKPGYWDSNSLERKIMLRWMFEAPFQYYPSIKALGEIQSS